MQVRITLKIAQDRLGKTNLSWAIIYAQKILFAVSLRRQKVENSLWSNVFWDTNLCDWRPKSCCAAMLFPFSDGGG